MRPAPQGRVPAPSGDAPVRPGRPVATTWSPITGSARLVTRHLEITRLEEASIPLHLIAYDLLSGREARLSEGPTIEAVLATAAIPGSLPPVCLGHRLLADGGVSNNTPISHAIELGAERIYVLPTENPGSLPFAPPTPRRARRRRERTHPAFRCPAAR